MIVYLYRTYYSHINICVIYFYSYFWCLSSFNIIHFKIFISCVIVVGDFHCCQTKRNPDLGVFYNPGASVRTLCYCMWRLASRRRLFPSLRLCLRPLHLQLQRGNRHSKGISLHFLCWRGITIQAETQRPGGSTEVITYWPIFVSHVGAI